MEEQPDIPSKKRIRQAGDILRNPNSTSEDFNIATGILSQWRQLHFYPMNTFQSYLRKNVKKSYPKGVVAQRLKRMPSIIEKLRRFPDMNLDRMQDICGFRIILKDLVDVYSLHSHFSKSKRFKHELILPPKDYIKNPKDDGYRSLHQVFKYNNPTRVELNDLRIELQIRTELQHSWATAVETLGIIEKSSFKTGKGSAEFKEFFKLSSQLFAFFEQKQAEDASFNPRSLLERLDFLEDDLRISKKLSGLAISAKHIDTSSKESTGYHLMELDLRSGTISLTAFSDAQLERAENLYSIVEKKKHDNPDFEVVLISAGNLAEIKKAYPNYFLDTKKFLSQLEKLKQKLRETI